MSILTYNIFIFLKKFTFNFHIVFNEIVYIFRQPNALMTLHLGPSHVYILPLCTSKKHVLSRWCLRNTFHHLMNRNSVRHKTVQKTKKAAEEKQTEP